MVFHCQECGKKVDEAFQFCPFCGKKLIKPKICMNCGMKLKDNFKFCPECGRKWSPSEKISKSKTKKTESVEKANVEKQEKKSQYKDRTENRAISPKFISNIMKKIKKPGKKILMILTIIVIIIIIASAVIFLNPFSSNGTTAGGTFTIDVDNYSDDIHYCIIVDGFPSIGTLTDPNIMAAGDSLTFTINENDLIIKKNIHSITFYASNDDAASWVDATASGVTESASFEITNVDQGISVNCTGYQ